jgi:hypothetical protein
MAICLPIRIHTCAGHEGRDIGDLGIFQGAGGFAACRSLSVFLVGCKVEGDEEEEVRADDAHACESREFLSGALASVRHPLPVG